MRVNTNVTEGTAKARFVLPTDENTKAILYMTNSMAGERTRWLTAKSRPVFGVTIGFRGDWMIGRFAMDCGGAYCGSRLTAVTSHDSAVA
jgi:hypothetical protein